MSNPRSEKFVRKLRWALVGVSLSAPSCEWSESYAQSGPGATTALVCKSAAACTAGLVCFLGHCAAAPRPCPEGTCTYPTLFACAEGILTRCDGCTSDIGCVARSACQSVDGGTCVVTPMPGGDY